MEVLRRVAWATALGVAMSAALVAVSAHAKDDKDNPRPKIVLKAQPIISVAPTRVLLTAELVGGKNDFEEYYCPEIEWDWGDGTTSASENDCQPYEAGKSEITRRFTVRHRFDTPGSFRVFFRMKKGDKVIGVASAEIQVRPGLGDPGK